MSKIKEIQGLYSEDPDGQHFSRLLALVLLAKFRNVDKGDV